MADEKLVALLRSGVDAWNKWRREHPGEQIDLSKSNLQRADLARVNLGWEFEFGEVDQHRKELIREAAQRGDFSGVLSILNAVRSEADLSGANLINAKLRAADLTGANLSGADLRDANLGEANVSRANLSEANLSGADFRRADLRSANLAGADLRGAFLIRAILNEANLSEANFAGTTFGFTVIDFCDLASAKNLDKALHTGPSTIGLETLRRSGLLPDVFVRGCGLSKPLILQLPSLMNQPIEYFSCFISYSHADKLFARRLFDTLQGRAIPCWLDEKDAVVGNDLHEEIERGIKETDKLLLCCSQHSLTESW